MTNKIKKPKFNAVSYSAGLRDGMDKAINKQTKSVIKLMELAREQGKKIRTEDILKLIDKIRFDKSYTENEKERIIHILYEIKWKI